MFKDVYIFKPLTSPDSNSEKFVVCMDYEGKGKFGNIGDGKGVYNIFPDFNFGNELINFFIGKKII